MKFLGIYREPEYSPGRHTSNDALILRLVAQALERQGVTIQLVMLDEARSQWKNADLIFSMLQGPRAIAEIDEWKKQGALILNDPASSRLTYRDSLCATVRQKELDFPRSEFLRTDGSESLERFETMLAGGAWVKRGDVHATQAGDVVRVNSKPELRKTLESFAKRGLTKVVLQEHREGDEVKFYAVMDGRLFWPFYPKESYGYPFDEHALEALAAKAAASIDIGIYGGDAIIGPDGSITLIDLNDWPSFAPCRGAAANAIALYLKDSFHAIKDIGQEAVSR
jgi:hypothetical protein